MDDFSWITVLTATVPAVLVLLINEIAHTVRHKRALNNQLLQLLLPDRIKACKEILGAISDHFGELYDNDRPDKLEKITRELIKDLSRVTLANAPIIGEGIEKEVHAFNKMLGHFHGILIEAIGSVGIDEKGGKSLEVLFEEIFEYRDYLDSMKKLLKLEIRDYAGFDFVERSLQKALRPTIFERIAGYIQKLKQHVCGKKSDKEAGGDGDG